MKQKRRTTADESAGRKELERGKMLWEHSFSIMLMMALLLSGLFIIALMGYQETKEQLSQCQADLNRYPQIIKPLTNLTLTGISDYKCDKTIYTNQSYIINESFIRENCEVQG